MLKQIPELHSELKAPDLCEIWTWQGDTSILPFKFESVLNSAANSLNSFFGRQTFNHSDLKKQYIDK